MNLSNHSIYVLFEIHIIIFFSVHQIVNSNDEQSQNRLRHKRVYNGAEVKDGEYPYVVFIKSFPTVKNDKLPNRVYCDEEKLCTGTLVHARFVLTLLSCVTPVNTNAKISPKNIQIFLKTRPYSKIKENMVYKIGQEVISKPSEYWKIVNTNNVALILMNDTFPEVQTYPKVVAVDPISYASTLPCFTVGYSLIGQNLPRPVDDLIKPRTYNITVMFHVTECLNSVLYKDHVPAYMCYAGKTDVQHSLCREGDEGSPLLCERPPRPAEAVTTTSERPGPNQTAMVRAKVRAGEGGGGGISGAGGGGNGDAAADDVPYVYGLAMEMPTCTGDGRPMSHKVLFLYMVMHGPWINQQLADYDDAAAAEANRTSTAATATASPESTTSAAAAELITTTVLPAYYDTSDYDAVQKNPMRCRLAAGHNSVPELRGPSIAVIDPEARGGHWPARGRGTAVAPSPSPSAYLGRLAFLCAAAAFYPVGPSS